jgi:hypothetical protein
MIENAASVEPIVIPSLICTYCGEPLDGEELENPYRNDSGDILCDECHREHYEGWCDLCNNIVEKKELESNPGELIAVWREAPGLGCEVAPGYYRVKQWPIYANGMITGYLFSDAIEKISDLFGRGIKVAAESDALCGKLCDDCRGRIEFALDQEG